MIELNVDIRLMDPLRRSLPGSLQAAERLRKIASRRHQTTETPGTLEIAENSGDCRRPSDTGRPDPPARRPSINQAGDSPGNWRSPAAGRDGLQAGFGRRRRLSPSVPCSGMAARRRGGAAAGRNRAAEGTTADRDRAAGLSTGGRDGRRSGGKGYRTAPVTSVVSPGRVTNCRGAREAGRV